MKNFFRIICLFLTFLYGEVLADPEFCGNYCPGNNYSDMVNMTGCNVSEEWKCNTDPQPTTTTVEGRVTTTCVPYDWSYTCPCNYLGCAETNASGECTLCNSGGGPCGPVGRYVSNIGCTNSKTCKYISSVTVNSWYSCVNGKQAPRPGAITWGSISGASCTDVVPVSRDCGICGESEGKSFGEAPMTNRCDFGNPTVPILVNGKWSWTCSPVDGEGGPVATCEANAYIDLGLNVYYDGQIRRVTVWAYGNINSPLRISKNGKIYSVVLVEENDPNIINVGIKTTTGVRYLRELD